MRFFITYLFCVLITISVVAQVNIFGTIIDSEDNEPLAGVSVIIKGTDGKIKKFTSSNVNGNFTLHMLSVAGCKLDITMMGYTKQSLPLDSVTFPLTIRLNTGPTLLKEVTVKADRISEQGDTITYNVSSFAQSQDHSIGDVLKRMPGIDVADNGKIQYQGEDINRFYIEGTDLLGGKYGLATNGINYTDVGAIEVLENHQPMQVLSGISFSDKAAINLKLKNNAKASWSYHGNIGGGFTSQPSGATWNNELFAMAAMSAFQSLTTFSTNNSGDDLSSSNTDFFAEKRDIGLSKYVCINLPNSPSRESNRTLFNRSILVSTNNLRKLRSGEFKANIDYTYNRVFANASNTTTYFLNGGNRVITENRNGTEHEHSLSGKFIYELNHKTVFINNTLQTNIDWNGTNLLITGSIPNSQHADLPDYYISNQFKMIQRFKEKHLVTFDIHNEWESLPQTLNINIKDAPYHQHISDHAFYNHESAAYAFSLNGVTVSIEGGIKSFWRSMNSNLPDIPGIFSGMTENVVHTNSFSIFGNSKLEYGIRRVNFSLNFPVIYAHYSFNKTIANRDETYFSPSLCFIWKPNSRFSGTVRGGVGRSPMNLNLIHPRLIMTDYRTFKSGVDNFYNSSSQNVSASISYKQTRHGLFGNVLVMQLWSHIPYTLSQQLFGDYIVYSYSDAKNDSKTFLTMGSIGKTLNFMRGSCNVNVSFNRNESRLLSEQQFALSVITRRSIGGKINGSPCKWLSFDYSINFTDSHLSIDSKATPWLSSMTNELSINFIPQSKWQWQVSGEHYRNELSDRSYKNFFMLDTRLIFKQSKQIELSASLTNILNKKLYNYTIYSQLSSFESQRTLRGRQLLFTITIKK